MAYEIRFTRLANSVRLTDRYLTIQAKVSTDPAKSSMGKLFALIEITNPWFPNSQIGQAIINTLTQEYYKFPGGNALNAFEAALKKVNETLAQITQKGETDWIGNLNGILALIIDNEIHLTQSGKAEAFLFRGSKINHITQGLTQELEPHPLKTFTNIISGELKKDDKILITSPALLDHLSQKELQEIIINNTPHEGTQEIAQFLRREKVRHINAVVLESISKTDLENQPLETGEVVYLDQTNGLASLASSTKKYTSQFGTMLESAGKGLALAWDKTKYFFKKEVSPRAKLGWQKTKEISKKGYDHFTTKTAPKIKEMTKPISQKIGQKIKMTKTELGKPKPEEAKKEPYSVHYYEEKKAAKSPVGQKLGPLAQKSRLILAKASRKTGEVWQWLWAKENRSVLYAVIAIILILVLIVNIGQLRKRQDLKKQQQAQVQMLEEAENQYQEAKLAVLYNDQDKAKNLLNEVIAKALEIMNNQPKLADQARELITKANEEFDKLTITTRFNDPRLVIEFPTVSQIFLLKEKVVTFDTANNNIYYITQDEQGDIFQLEGPSSSTEGNYQAFSFDDRENNILAFTNKNQLYKISDPDIKAEKITPAHGAWERAIDLFAFIGNLYFLDSVNGQIWRHTGTAEGYAAGSGYVDTGQVDLKNGLSLTIDGSIYVLKSDNSVLKLSHGRLQDFSLRDIPTPNDKITKGKKIWTSSEITSLYILDGNRIIEFDKTGKFTRQFAFSPDLQNITDFFLQPQEHKIWVLNDKKVYQVGY